MFRLPPTSTLFPYTTLFRSNPQLKDVPTMEEVGFKGFDAMQWYGSVEALEADLDRKSTRLNSSHRCISYAVFCLKKKKMRKGTNVATNTTRCPGCTPITTKT